MAHSLSHHSLVYSFTIPFAECDHMFIHTDTGPTKGTFSSPNYNISDYPPDLQCIYTFVAKPNYRVKIIFADFRLTGAASSCTGGDYVDIYSEMVSPEVDLIKQTLSGRYCGSVSPRVRISYHHVLVLILHTRRKSLGERGFTGNYKFISSDEFKIGTPAAPGICGFTIDQAHHQQSAKIISPTYPGTYPRNLHCYYKLIGRPGQRIRLYLSDFDLYFGGEHCPYDSLTVYDGPDNKSPIITRICGLQQKIELYSEKNHIFIEFNSTNPPYAEHRGFEIEYVFSKRFVDIGKLIGGEAGVSHMRGTQCDLRVQSNSRTKHIITSPNYPNNYPVNTTCIYLLDGLQGAQDLEKVILQFHTFAITSWQGDVSNDNECPYDTYVGVTQSLKLERGEWTFAEPNLCGSIMSGSPFMKTVSTGPRLIVFFKSGEDPLPQTKSLGFRATVKFETDYGISGTPSSLTSLCDFTFKYSARSKQFRSFNSPRYPANYPLGKNCTYHLIGSPGKRVRIFFEQFALHKGKSVEDQCADYVKLYNVYEGGRESLIAKYCPQNHPGPVVSDYDAFMMRVEFNADDHGTNTGFKAIYDFLNRESREIPPTNTDCGGLIQGSTGGWLTSPHYPAKYLKGHICTWELRVREGHKIIVQPIEITVEGSMGTAQDPRVNCQQAVIRFYPDSSGLFSHEFCGDSVPELISKQNYARLTFITGPQKVNGLKGFNFTWTQVRKTDVDCEGSDLFRCKQSLYCIDSDMQCNGVPNCGVHDVTDEANCFVAESSSKKTLILALSGSGLVLILLLILVCIVLRRHWARKAHKKRHSKHSSNRRHQKMTSS